MKPVLFQVSRRERALVPEVLLESRRHNPACETLCRQGRTTAAKSCPGVVEYVTIFAGKIWRISIPACNCRSAYQIGHLEIIEQSGFDFISRADAEKLVVRFDAKDQRLRQHSLSLSPRNIWFLRPKVLEFYLEREFYCDLCHGSVKPEIPVVHEFPATRFSRRGQRYEYVEIPGKLTRFQVCRHCVRYRLHNTRKEHLWQLQQAVDLRKERETISKCKQQLKALRSYLKKRDPEALKSLPEGFGPAAISPTSCPPS